jgi:hypothetical protein
MTERATQTQIMLALGSRHDVRIFRNNVGQGWQGRMVSHRGGVVTLADARPLHAGLFRGSADLIGWQTVTVTPEMVGKPIAIILSVECKSLTGRPTPEQANWLETVTASGGLACIARSPAEATSILYPHAH